MKCGFSKAERGVWRGKGVFLCLMNDWQGLLYDT